MFIMHQQLHGVIHGTGPDDLHCTDEEYLICIFDGVKPVGNNNAGGGIRKFLKNCLQLLLGDCINISSGLIEN